VPRAPEVVDLVEQTIATDRADRRDQRHPAIAASRPEIRAAARSGCWRPTAARRSAERAPGRRTSRAARGERQAEPAGERDR
jgi:hypothetical protein